MGQLGLAWTKGLQGDKRFLQAQRDQQQKLPGSNGGRKLEECLDAKYGRRISSYFVEYCRILEL